MSISTLEQLNVWREAHALALATYRTTGNFPRHELFGLTSQTRRAAVSVSANIAEGFKRRKPNDKRYLYTIAAASLEELRAELLLARDLGYLNRTEGAVSIFQQIDSVARLLHRWSSGCS